MTTPTTATGFRGSLSETPLPQVLRRIFLEGLKGTLSLVHGDETRHLFFEKGELRTATSSREGAADRRVPQAAGLDHRHRPQLGARHRRQAGAGAAREDPRRARARVPHRARRRDAPARRGDRLLDLRLGHGRVQVPGLGRRPGSRRRPDALDRGGHRRGHPPPAGIRVVPRAPGRRPPRPDAGHGPDVPLPVPPARAAGGVPPLARRRDPGRGLAAEDHGHVPRGDGQDPLRPRLVRDRRVEAGRRRTSRERPRRIPRPERRSGGAALGPLAGPRGAREEHVPPHRLADPLRAARRRARGVAREDLRGLLRAQPALSPRPAAPRGPGALRKGADRRLRAHEEGVRDALRSGQAGPLRPEPRRGPGPGAHGRGGPGDAQEAGDPEFPARPAAHRGQGLPPGRRDAARGRALRSRQRRVPLRAVAGRAEEPELDGPGAREPEGGRAPRQPPRRVLGGSGASAARVQAAPRSRALRAARRLARPLPGERGTAHARARRGGRRASAAGRARRGRPRSPRPRRRPRRPQPSGLLSRLFRHRG